ncbi:MAG: hypothetical protein M3485_07775 [Pseudomonadota bacterium]|nr:hypothetical protein [Pseudomonadota bacterium]
MSAGPVVAGKPIPIESLARVPDIQSVSMSSDGRNLVALVAAPGSNHRETALATWDLDNLEAGPTITPSGDLMKFVGASAMKADRVLVFARQEWTGQLGGCGEGRVSGATKTFVIKSYLTDTKHAGFNEAFTDNTRRIGISQDMQRCLEIAGTAELVNTLPLDPDNVIVMQVNELTLSGNHFLYNLRTRETKLLLRSGGRSSPGLFNPRNGELMTRTEVEPVGSDEYEQRILIRIADTGEFVVHENLTVKGLDPMLNTAKASIPVLLYVDDRDVRTPAFHARGFFNAIKGTVPARFELIPNMPHSLPWYYSHQNQTLKLIEEFLREDCGPGGL